MIFGIGHICNREYVTYLERYYHLQVPLVTQYPGSAEEATRRLGAGEDGRREGSRRVPCPNVTACRPHKRYAWHGWRERCNRCRRPWSVSRTGR